MDRGRFYTNKGSGINLDETQAVMSAMKLERTCASLVGTGVKCSDTSRTAHKSLPAHRTLDTLKVHAPHFGRRNQPPTFRACRIFRERGMNWVF
jgi:hypothetical protein